MKYKIVFMGTPEFAVPSLSKLYESNLFDILSVYTQADKPVGRKQILTPPEIKVFALEKGLDIKQPIKIKNNNEVLEHLKSLDLDFIVVVAYGKILPKSILDIPKYGCINLHGSLLEKYRGAAPIQWAIANGEEKTGVTIMKMDEGMDTGDIYTKAEIKIDFEDTYITLSKKLSELGSNLLVETLLKIANNEISSIKQDNNFATIAPIIKKEDGLIDWNKSALSIYNLNRAFTPWPLTYTYFRDKTLKIIKCLPINEEAKGIPGEIIDINKNDFSICTGNGKLLVKMLQLEGSKEMSSGDFIRGQRLEKGIVLGK
jgi:methionyl-tRNA formyltransferase